jgi:hypothetical protein
MCLKCIHSLNLINFCISFRDKQEEIPVSPRVVRQTTGKTVDSQSVTETSETSIDSQKVTAVPLEPSESAIHGREVHVAKQKQTQKEVCTETFYIVYFFNIFPACCREKHSTVHC